MSAIATTAEALVFPSLAAPRDAAGEQRREDGEPAGMKTQTSFRDIGTPSALSAS